MLSTFAMLIKFSNKSPCQSLATVVKSVQFYVEARYLDGLGCFSCQKILPSMCPLAFILRNSYSCLVVLQLLKSLLQMVFEILCVKKVYFQLLLQYTGSLKSYHR